MPGEWFNGLQQKKNANPSFLFHFEKVEWRKDRMAEIWEGRKVGIMLTGWSVFEKIESRKVEYWINIRENQGRIKGLVGTFWYLRSRKFFNGSITINLCFIGPFFSVWLYFEAWYAPFY